MRIHNLRREQLKADIRLVSIWEQIRSRPFSPREARECRSRRDVLTISKPLGCSQAYQTEILDGLLIRVVNTLII